MSGQLGVENRVGGERFQRALSSGAEHTCRKTLLFISPPGSISEAMTAAIEREFSWISVMHISEPEMAYAKFDRDVELIIVDQSLLNAFYTHCDKSLNPHPGANTAVMTAARFNHWEELTDVIEARAICGILLQDVNLDIWLSIIRILLKGGEYFPHALFQPPHQPETRDRSMLEDPRPHRSGSREQRSMMMDGLTEREVEILGMVAQGNQNKIIAFNLGLSEHTVKIHIHNVIQKLGVHNRTEAAAQYFKYIHLLEEASADDELKREEEDNDGQENDRVGKFLPNSDK